MVRHYLGGGPETFLLSLKAKGILDVLEKSNQRNAADTLRDRIVLVEACDVLVVKDLKTMKHPAFQKILALTNAYQGFFQTTVKLKIVEHHVHQVILEGINQAVVKGKPDQRRAGLMEVAEALVLTTLDLSIGTDFHTFDAMKPTWDGVFHELLGKLFTKLRSLGHLPVDDQGETSFDLSIEAASKKTPEATDIAELKELNTVAKAMHFEI